MGNASRHIAPAKRIIPQHSGDLLIVIPAAAAGNRMKSHGIKSLIPLSNQVTVLERQLWLLWQCYPKAEIISTVGFEAARIDKAIDRAMFPLRLVINERYEDTSIIHSIALAVYASTCQNILIVHGDLVFNQATINGLVGETSKIVIDNSKQISEEKVGVNVQNGRVSYLAYGFDQKWSKIVYLTGKEASLYRSIVKNPDYNKLLSHEILNKVIDKGGIFEVVEPNNMKIVEIDSTKDLERATRIND